MSVHLLFFNHYLPDLTESQPNTLDVRQTHVIFPSIGSELTPRVPTKSPGSIQSLQLLALDFVPLLKLVAPSFSATLEISSSYVAHLDHPTASICPRHPRVPSAISSSIFFFFNFILKFSLPISSEVEKLKIRPFPLFFNLRPPFSDAGQATSSLLLCSQIREEVKFSDFWISDQVKLWDFAFIVTFFFFHLQPPDRSISWDWWSSHVHHVSVSNTFAVLIPS